MYYCEKCRMIMKENCCSVCGKKKLREVQDDDFCFFVALDADKTRFFEENLESHGIPSASLGAGLDLRTRGSSTYKIYVPYAFFDKAKELYKLLFGE